MDQITFMGIRMDNVTLEEALSRVRACIEAREKMYVVTPNVDHVVKLQHDERFREAYAHAGLVTVDGSPIYQVAKWYGTPFKEKICGPNLAESAVRLASEHGYSVFFLGAAPGVSDMAAERLLAKYPGFRYAGSYAPPAGFEHSEQERSHIIRVINDAHPDIVIAGMGSPKTEIFLMEIYPSLHACVSFSTGAAIDFMAGRVSRCPAWVNRIGMEWFYRFLKEPRRLFRRYFVDDLAFFPLIFKYWPGKKAAKRKEDSAHGSAGKQNR